MNGDEPPPHPHHDYPPLLLEIGGVWAGDDLQRNFQHEVSDLIGRHNLNFPGAQPVSFAAKHIQELKREDYYVCEKTDGMRFLMYMTQDGPNAIHYLIDRKNNYYFIPDLHYPHHEDKSFSRFHTATILDGELVQDRYPNRPPVNKFLVFDLLVIDGTKMLHRPLDKRLAYFKSQILDPYKAFYKAHPAHPRPFITEDKSTEFSYGLEKMFKEIIPRVKQLHGNDGLIFTCRSSAYKHGTDEHILKWKPPEENTIDLLLHITWPEIPANSSDPDRDPYVDYLAMPLAFDLYVHKGTDRQGGGVADYAFFDTLYVTEQDWNKMKAENCPLQDVVAECFQEAFDPENDSEQPAIGINSNKQLSLKNGHTTNGHHDDNETNGTELNNGTSSRVSTRWRYHRLRPDKLESNHITVVESVMQSIADRVTEEDLLAAAPSIRAAWKGREEERKTRATKGAGAGG